MVELNLAQELLAEDAPAQPATSGFPDDDAVAGDSDPSTRSPSPENEDIWTPHRDFLAQQKREEEDLERARLESLNELRFQGPSQDYRPEARWRALVSQTGHPRDDLQNPLTGEIPLETVLRLSNEFAPIIEKGADTLVYIGPPPQAANQDDHEYEHIKLHFHRPYLMRSDTFKQLKSSQFDKFLGPMSARIERKLKKLEIHKRVMRIDSIKYYIDLRPMLDDEEALLMLTELTSTPGVLNWHTKGSKYGIPPEITCGRDNLNIPVKPRYKCTLLDDNEDFSPQLEDTSMMTPVMVSEDTNEWQDQRVAATKKSPNIYRDKVATLEKQPPEEEYSPLRHHLAIERLLHAIVGEDPKLDSAPKAWTYFAIAKHFDCVHNPVVNEWIMTWLLASNNINFIQANPEVVYRIATGMHSPSMLRSTYAMLVGEKALLQLQVPRSPSMPRHSIHGRPLALLDDDDINRIDHAVPSLIHRVKDIFDQLFEPTLQWAYRSPNPEMIRLFSMEIQNPEDYVVLNDVRIHLQNYIYRMILSALVAQPSPDLGKVSDSMKQNAQVYTFLPLSARIFTRSFWTELRALGFFSDTDSDGSDGSNAWPHTVWRLKKESIITESKLIPFVSKWTLFNAFSDLNKMIYRHHCGITDPFKGAFVNYRGEMIQEIAKVDEYGRPLPQRAFPSQPPYAHGEASTHYRSKFHEMSAEMNGWNTSRTLGEQAYSTSVASPGGVRREVTSASHVSNEPSQGQPRQAQDMGVQTDDIFQYYETSDAEGQTTFTHQDQSVPSSLPFRPFRPRSFLQPTQNAPTSDQNEQHPSTAAESQLPELPDVPKSVQWADQVPSDSASTTGVRSLSAVIPNDPQPGKTCLQNSISKEQYGFISAPALLCDLTEALRQFIDSAILTPGYVSDGTCDIDLPTTDVDTLLCLTDDEWKYLPLWAGGLDDGSGGVFASNELGGGDVPDALDIGEGGFRGGPTAGLLSSAAPTEVADSVCMVDASELDDRDDDFEDIQTDEGVSTVGKASRIATDGTRGGASTVMSLDD